MAKQLDKATPQARLDLCNSLARCEALVRNNVGNAPVNYSADIDAALADVKAKVDAVLALV